MGNWFYNDKRIEDISDFPEGTFGFIYITIHEPSCKALKNQIGKHIMAQLNL